MWKRLIVRAAELAGSRRRWVRRRVLFRCILPQFVWGAGAPGFNTAALPLLHPRDLLMPGWPMRKREPGDSPASAALRDQADSITPQRWAQIKDLFHAALEL